MDCEHLALEAETEDVHYPHTILQMHTLRCVVCGLSARMIRRIAHVSPSS